MLGGGDIGCEVRGVNVLALAQIFEHAQRTNCAFAQVKVELSFLDLYSEQIRNLLVEEDDDQTLVALYQNSLREFVPMSGGKGRRLEDLRLVQVNSVEEAVECLQVGVDRRAAWAEQIPGYEQQSISVFTVHVTTLEQEEDGSQTIMKSKLNLVELRSETLRKARSVKLSLD